MGILFTNLMFGISYPKGDRDDKCLKEGRHFPFLSGAAKLLELALTSLANLPRDEEPKNSEFTNGFGGTNAQPIRELLLVEGCILGVSRACDVLDTKTHSQARDINI
ncbi:hypothetical protein TNCV_4519891 [Trichonephila clavipes]|nr:hypothetical protein TNCV_4519891 [Trichonephila clavipes]